VEIRTPFDAALQDLLRAWCAHDDLAADPAAPLRDRARAWVEVDRARELVRALTPPSGAASGRQ
jgi:hypothetical protein